MFEKSVVVYQIFVYPTLTLPLLMGGNWIILSPPFLRAGLFHSLKGSDLQAFQAKKSGD